MICPIIGFVFVFGHTNGRSRPLVWGVLVWMPVDGEDLVGMGVVGLVACCLIGSCLVCPNKVFLVIPGVGVVIRGTFGVGFAFTFRLDCCLWRKL